MPTVLEVVTPEALVVSRAVDMVVIPAREGDMGVLEGHMPMIVTLRGGLVVLYEAEQASASWFVLGGFAEVTPDRCTVLTDLALPPAELRRDQAEALVLSAEAAYAALPADGAEALGAARDAIDAAGAMLEAATRPEP
jgi:F-type H+-transporting ATPase subunit epsilon